MCYLWNYIKHCPWGVYQILLLGTVSSTIPQGYISGLCIFFMFLHHIQATVQQIWKILLSNTVCSSFLDFVVLVLIMNLYIH